MANGFLLLGSVLLFQYFIAPVAELLTDSLSGGDSSPSSITSMSVWSFYHLLWVLPIWALCYVVSLGCYQSIADEVYRLRQKEQSDLEAEGVRGGERGLSSSPPRGVKRTISGTIYATLVWALMLLLTRVFDLLVPLLLAHLSQLLSLSIALLPPSLHHLASALLLHPLYLASVLSRLLGFVLMSVVYGWYGFDMAWISEGLEPDDRFRRVEEHWVYFMGFGLPYVLLLRLPGLSFFLAYGLYLMAYPFTIMLGSCSDFRLHYKYLSAKLHSAELQHFRVFQPAQTLAMRVIKAVDRYLRPPSGKKKR